MGAFRTVALAAPAAQGACRLLTCVRFAEIEDFFASQFGQTICRSSLTRAAASTAAPTTALEMADTPAEPSSNKANPSAVGRFRIDLRSAENVRAGRWRLLARLGKHTIDLPFKTSSNSTEWSPGSAGGVLGDGVLLSSVLDRKLELTIWSDEKAAEGKPPVRCMPVLFTRTLRLVSHAFFLSFAGRPRRVRTRRRAQSADAHRRQRLGPSYVPAHPQ